MIVRNIETQPVEMSPGVIRRTLVSSNNMMICEFKLETNAEIPIHNHPHEQMGYIVSGQVRMTIGDESIKLGSGDSYCALSKEQHGALALERSVIIDIFYPPREEYR